jgi:hypothetical protein
MSYVTSPEINHEEREQAVKRKQSIVLYIGAIAFALRAFFPPLDRPAFMPAIDQAVLDRFATVNMGLLIIQELAILLLTGVAYFTLKGRR